MLNATNADVYTDFNGLAKLKNEARNNSPEAIKEVAKQFESVFMTMVLKSMRQAKLADGIMDSKQSEFFRDMYDQQMALHLSGETGIGLAELIARQLSPKQDDVQEKMSAEDYLKRSASLAPVVRKPTVRVDSEHQAVETRQAAIKKVEDKPINSKEQFIETLRPAAEKAAARLGVDADVLLAQAALETGWGKSVIEYRDGRSSFNLFNIKADKAWQGKQVKKATLEFENGIGRKEMAAFRAYDSYRDSFNDYVRFIKDNPRYHDAIKMAHKPERYMHELQQAGYATDPGYAEKVMRIYRDVAASNQVATL